MLHSFSSAQSIFQSHNGTRALEDDLQLHHLGLLDGLYEESIVTCRNIGNGGRATVLFGDLNGSGMMIINIQQLDGLQAGGGAKVKGDTSPIFGSIGTALIPSLLERRNAMREI